MRDSLPCGQRCGGWVCELDEDHPPPHKEHDDAFKGDGTARWEQRGYAVAFTWTPDEEETKDA